MSPADGQVPSPDEDFDAIASAIAADTAQRPVAPRQFNDVAAAPVQQDAGFSQQPAAPQPIQVIEPTPEQYQPASVVAPSAAPVVTESAEAEVAAPEQAAPASKKSGILGVRTIAEVALVLLVLGAGSYVFTLRSDNARLRSEIASVAANPQLVVERQTKTQIAKVGQLMQLPADETPTVANVSDAAKAKTQSAFFNNAQNGDTVLMYVKSGQAILYRPTTNQIVLVAPLTFDGKATAATATTPAATR